VLLIIMTYTELRKFESISRSRCLVGSKCLESIYLKDFESQRILNPDAILSPDSPDLADADDADKVADQLTVPRTARLLSLIRPLVLPCPLCANIGYQETDTLLIGRVQMGPPKSRRAVSLASSFGVRRSFNR
jgi:hypothetical protein